jgi:hypothetical protein
VLSVCVSGYFDEKEKVSVAMAQRLKLDYCNLIILLYKLFSSQAMIANVCGNDYVNKYTELPKK